MTKRREKELLKQLGEMMKKEDFYLTFLDLCRNLTEEERQFVIHSLFIINEKMEAQNAEDIN